MEGEEEREGRGRGKEEEEADEEEDEEKGIGILFIYVNVVSFFSASGCTSLQRSGRGACASSASTKCTWQVLGNHSRSQSPPMKGGR